MTTFFDNQFNLLQNPQLYDKVVVLVKAESCPACRNFLPVFKQVAADPAFSHSVSFAIISAEEELALARGLLEKHKTSNIPTSLVYNRGKFVTKTTGNFSAEDFKKFLAAAINE